MTSSTWSGSGGPRRLAVEHHRRHERDRCSPDSAWHRAGADSPPSRRLHDAEACVLEVWENRHDWNRKKVPEALVKEALDFLTDEFVSVVPRSAYREKEGEAAGLIRDPDDVPVVALRILGTAEVKSRLAAL